MAVIGIIIITIGTAFSQTGDGNENEESKKKYFYEWTDDQGGMHIADGLGKVPEKYRSRVRQRESQQGKEIIIPEPAQRNFQSGPSTDSPEEEAKEYWQQRVHDWKKRLSDAEQRYRDLDRERMDLFRAWGSAAVAPAENKIKAEQIEQEMKDLEAEINTARKMIETEIPEEARKAGIPPGWLRE